MSVYGEISRIANNIDRAKRAIEYKDVAVPQNATSNHLYDLIMQIRHISDDVMIVHGVYSGNIGTADCGYDQISYAMSGGGIPIGKYLIGKDPIGGYDKPRYIFLILREQIPEQQEVVHLGALYSIDATNEKAVFSLGTQFATINTSAEITIE